MSNPDLALAESVSTTNASYFIAVYLLILLYCCFGLAVVCDVYFVPALQKLSYNIAGSTLMALGASVPELFASLIGVFVTEDDIGTGSIIGSSSFNLIAVPAACSFVAAASFGSGALRVNPTPVTRNSAFYAIIILVLLLIIKDNKVDIPESVILLLFFVMYMAFMIFSAQSKRRRTINNHNNENDLGKSQNLDDINKNNKNNNRRNSVSANVSRISHPDSAITSDHDDSNQNSFDCNSIHSDTSTGSSNKTLSYEAPTSMTGHRKTQLNTSDPGRGATTGPTRQLTMITTKKQPVNYGSKYHDKVLQTQQGASHYNTIDFDQPNQILIDHEFNEKTPLVVGAGPSRNELNPYIYYYQYSSLNDNKRNNFGNQQLDHHYHNDNDYQQQPKKDSINNHDSISVYPGFATKKSSPFPNSANNLSCLIDINNVAITESQKKAYQKIEGCSSNRNDRDSEKHSNWVSSNWILVPMFPLTFSMKLLMPGKFKTTFWTIWSFLISIFLIGALTYVSVWMVHSLSRTLGIPETVAGMTILSWGTGIPELIASIVLIRKTAEADMAISNTIGSNVIDISFCLSLPWVVKCFINQSYGLEPTVEIQSEALPWTSSLLLISVVLLIIILKCHDWKLCYGVGIWLMVVYTVFVISSILLEYSFTPDGLNFSEIISNFTK